MIDRNAFKSPTETVVEHSKRALSKRSFPPLRTLEELADEFGVSRRLLIARLSRDPEAPKAKLRTGGNGLPRHTWLEPKAVRAWWKLKGAQVGPDRRSLDALSLGLRPMINLRAIGITTVDALVALTEKDVLRVPNLGPKSVAEIRDALAAQGLSLRVTK